jgi:tight adherence protein B
VHRLAVLTAAGLPAVAAWRSLAEAEPRGPAAAVADGLTSAADLPARIGVLARPGASNAEAGSDALMNTDVRAWGVLAAIWSVAAEAGAPLAPTLERTAEVLRGLGADARAVEVALSGPRATSRVVLALPVVAVAMGALLGFDMLGAFASLPGLLCAGAAAVLMRVAARWNRRLLRWARESDPAPGIECELLALAMSGGMPPERARAVVAGACRASGLDPGDEADAVLAFAQRAGVPVAALLRAESDAARREARASTAERIAQLETRLLLPLGLCVLPAFVLAGVVPVGIAILSSTALAA